VGFVLAHLAVGVGRCMHACLGVSEVGGKDRSRSTCIRALCSKITLRDTGQRQTLCSASSHLFPVRDSMLDLDSDDPKCQPIDRPGTRTAIRLLYEVPLGDHLYHNNTTEPTTSGCSELEPKSEPTR
jgi:hypothetical protein